MNALSLALVRLAPWLARSGPYLLIFFLAYLGLRVASMSAIEEPFVTFDSRIYLRLAGLPLWAPRFWAGERPWTTPLAFKLVGLDLRWILWFHVALSVACWTALAATLARHLQAPPLRLAAWGIVLLFSMASDILIWDGNIMSESVSLSLSALLVALWLRLIERWRWPTAMLLMLTVLLWAFTRDPNAWLLLMAAGLCALAGAVRRSARRHLVIAGFLAVCFVASLTGSNLASRWLVPFLNIVGHRILPHPERVAAFEQFGMPATQALMRRTGKSAWSDGWAFFNDPGLLSFWAWVNERGRSSYVQYLVTHPVATLVDPLRDLDGVISPDFHRWPPRGFSPVLFGLADALYVRRGALLWVLAGAALGVAALVTMRRRWDVRLLVPVALVGLVYPYWVFVWQADPTSIDRHSLPIGVQLRLGVWMLALVLADMAWSGRGWPWVALREADGSQTGAAPRSRTPRADRGGAPSGAMPAPRAPDGNDGRRRRGWRS
jgi:hypothetical protein